MRKIFIVFLLLGLYSIGFAGHGGDSLGSHKAVRPLNMRNHGITNLGSTDGSNIFGVGLSTSTATTTDGRAGENLTLGDVVYISGATGTKAQFKKADFDSITDEEIESIGIAAETKNNGQAILVRNLGILLGVDMSNFSAGDELFLWETGAMTNVRPSSGTVAHVGHALNALAAPNGAIMVHHETPVTGAYGQVGHPAIIRMGDGDVVSFRDGQDNEIATMTKSSITYKSGYWVYFSSAYIYELWTSSIRSLSPINIISDEVNIAGGAMNVLNGTGSKASSYIRVNESDKLALVISSAPDPRPSTNDPTDERYSAVITSHGHIHAQEYWGDHNGTINLKQDTTHYGSQWGRGHDSKGWDNSSANSFTIFDEYTLPTADGDADDIIETDGAGTLSWVPPAGGEGGNKNDEVNLEAEQFSTAGATNNAAIYLHQKEITYDGVTSTGAMFTVKLPDSARPNHAFASMNWSRQWDDGPVNIYVTFVTSSTSDGTANLRVGIGTCTFVGANFEIYDSTAQVGNGWCDQRTATMTISSTSILFDGKHIVVYIGKGSEDITTQIIYVLNVKFGYVKD